MKQLAYYRPEGVAGAAYDVGGHLSRGFHLVEIWCRPCHRMEHITVQGLPLHLPIADLWRHYRCSECGGQNLASQASIKEMIAHWDVGLLDGRTPL